MLGVVDGIETIALNALKLSLTKLLRLFMPRPLKKPTPPADDDCCGGGACNPCVWDNYYNRLQKWRIEQAKIREEAEKNATDQTSEK